jgi:4-amino-4-deoxy-L-arabinose transferase-like glycosyltransferase
MEEKIETAAAAGGPGEKGTGRALLLLLLVPLSFRAALLPLLAVTYDEAAYSWTASRLFAHGGWLDFYGVRDLFFWPPLFNYLAALPVALGIDRLYAVRIVTLIISSGIPPLLYLLVLRAGYGSRAAWLAALFWIVNPWVLRYSVVGEPDVPLLAFVLLAAVLLQRARDDGRVRTAVLSAAALAASIWLKETAIGLAPLFPLLLWRRRTLLLAWILAFLAFLLPVLAPSFLSTPYGLFFELNNPLVRWNGIRLDNVLIGIIRIQGLEPLADARLQFAASLMVAVTLVVSVASAWTAIRRGDFLLRFSAASLLVFIAFFAVFWKKYTWYAITPYAFLVPFLGVYLSRFRRWAWIYLALLILPSAIAVVQFTNRHGEAALLAALRAAESERRDASVVVMPPRLAELLVERSGLAVRVAPVPYGKACEKRPEDCLLDDDYLLGRDRDIRTMLTALFCGKPNPPGDCGRVAGSFLVPARLVGVWEDQWLYRVHAPEASK